MLADSSIKTVLSLDGQWTVYYAAHAELKDSEEYRFIDQLEECGFSHIEAQVPGNFELDLQRAGRLEDLLVGDAVRRAVELENQHLWYTLRFYSPMRGDSGTHLRFEGIDTFSEVYLNGELVGCTDNMLITHEIPVPLLRSGENQLVVHIRPVFLEARKHPVGAGSFVHQSYNAESLSVRKAAHMYGWDIMPRILSGGLWRSVTLVEKASERIEELYLYSSAVSTERAAISAFYHVQVTGDHITDYSLEITGQCGDATFSFGRKKLWSAYSTWNIWVEQPKLWWTKNLGEPNLYDVTATLYRKGRLLCEKKLRFGIRKVELFHTSTMSEAGEGTFHFQLNGERLFVLGTNWVPLSPYHSEDTKRLPQALELLDDSGCNMVRCWGGNVYESEAFFDFCDMHGIAVWQDFAFGCASYPQTDYFFHQVETETEWVVKELRNHASLFLWCGDNEGDVACMKWRETRVNPNRNRITREVIPRVLDNHDPEHPYLPSSPYVDADAWKEGWERLPEDHLWGPRDYYKGQYYTSAAASFASEIGYHGCPSPRSVRRFISPNKVWPWQNNDEWLYHATCMETEKGGDYQFRIPLMASQVETLFNDVPDGLASFALASQISQAEAMKFFVERFRLHKGEKNGIIWWNLLDGWPQFSDAVVDYFYTKKLAYFILRNAQQPVYFMLDEPVNGVSRVVGANEHRHDVATRLKITNTETGELLLEVNTSLPANAAISVGTVAVDSIPAIYLLEWDGTDGVHRNYYLGGKPPYSFQWYTDRMRRIDFLTVEGFTE